MEGNRLLHQRRLDVLFAVDFELAQFAFAADPGLVQAPVGGDSGTLDLFARGDLGFLQRLHPGDLELFDGAAACDPCRFKRLFARDVRGVDFLAGIELRLLDLPVGVDPL
jgi:hypothetical protein